MALTLPVEAIPHLADSVAYFLEKEVAELAIEPAVVPGVKWSPRLHDALERQFARIFEISLRHYELTGEVPLVLFRRTAEASRHGPRGRSLCGVGSGEAIAVDVDGEVEGCVTFARSCQQLPSFLEQRLAPMRMGKIDAPDFEERHRRHPEAVKAAQIFDDHQNEFSSYGRCGDCRHLSECTICPVTIGYQSIDPDPHRIPDFACAYNLISLDYRARFPRQPTPSEVLRGAAPISGWMRTLKHRAEAAERVGQRATLPVRGTRPSWSAR